MKLKTLRIVSAMLMAATLPAAASAQPAPSVRVSLKPDTLLMGKTATLSLQIDQPEKSKASVDLVEQMGGQRYLSLLGDSVEISSRFRLDTVKLGDDRIRVNYAFNVQSFDSGYYRLPDIRVTCDGRTLTAPGPGLAVIPVKIGDTEDEMKISPFTSVAEPEDIGKDDEEKSSDFFKKYWWLMLITLAVGAFVVWAVIRYRRTGTLLPVKPIVPPYDEAMDSMRRLHSGQLWQKGKEKDYYTVLTFILRRYLSKEYGIPAIEMTSRQIMAAVKENKDLSGMRDMIRSILDMADFVKYAKVRPLPDDNEKAYDDSMKLLKEAHRLHLEEQKRLEAAKASEVENKQRNRKKKAMRRGKRK